MEVTHRNPARSGGRDHQVNCLPLHTRTTRRLQKQLAFSRHRACGCRGRQFGVRAGRPVIFPLSRDRRRVGDQPFHVSTSNAIWSAVAGQLFTRAQGTPSPSGRAHPTVPAHATARLRSGQADLDECFRTRTEVARRTAAPRMAWFRWLSCPFAVSATQRGGVLIWQGFNDEGLFGCRLLTDRPDRRIGGRVIP